MAKLTEVVKKFETKKGVTKEEIKKQVDFQEQYFKSTIALLYKPF